MLYVLFRFLLPSVVLGAFGYLGGYLVHFVTGLPWVGIAGAVLGAAYGARSGWTQGMVAWRDRVYLYHYLKMLGEMHGCPPPKRLPSRDDPIFGGYEEPGLEMLTEEDAAAFLAAQEGSDEDESTREAKHPERVKQALKEEQARRRGHEDTGETTQA